MRVAVAGATGNIGALTVAALERDGHEVVPISRRLGVDLTTGEGLDERVVGVDAVVDVLNGPAATAAEAVEYFGTTTRNLLAAEARAGVGHHVLLAIAGMSRVEGNAHYAGKREQERLVADGPVPWSIVPATQFHDFPAMVAGWNERDGTTTVPPLLLQPIAPADVADILAEIAAGLPQGRTVDIAGPDTHDLVDMAQRTYAARGRSIRIVAKWSSMFGPDTPRDGLLPGPDARIAPTTFEQWLEQLAG